MKCLEVLLFPVLIVLSFENAISESKSASESEIEVISFYPDKQINYERLYQNTGSWAKIENVTKLTLPENFTVCSAISINNFDIGWPFFTLLGHNQRYPFLSAVLYDTNPESPISQLRYLFGRNNRGRKQKAKGIPLVYPNQWVHSCMALSMRNSNLTHLQWMVSGILVANETQETDGNHPQDLANRMILGKLSKANYFKRKQKMVAKITQNN